MAEKGSLKAYYLLNRTKYIAQIYLVILMIAVVLLIYVLRTLHSANRKHRISSRYAISVYAVRSI